MASTQVRHAPERTAATTSDDHQATTKRTDALEDRLDYKTVRQARALASKRNEKPTSWQVFKKKLAR